MPVSVDVWLYPFVDCTLPHPCSDKLHAAIFNVARDNNAALTTAIHDAGENKPFALSTLWPRSRVHNGDSMSILANTGCRFRICTLNNDATELFVGTLSALMATGGPLRLGQYDFKLHSVEINEHNGTLNYADLPADMTSVVLQFKSPTTFRRAGVSYPLPDQTLVFGSLWRRWQEYSAGIFDQQVFDEVLTSVALSRADIRTRTWKFPKYQLTGFTGAAEFTLVNAVSPAARLLFGALANYARFASVGLRTTMGLGQCIVMPRVKNAETEIQNDVNTENNGEEKA